jgi:hypothetical protein
MNSASNEDLDAWTLSSEEYELSAAKIGANRLDFALLLKCFQIVGRFPSATSAIEADLGGHPKAASRGHLKTGQRSVATFKTGQ